MRELIHQYKFRSRRRLAPFLAEAVHSQIVAHAGALIVPVPPTRSRLRMTGFAPVGLIARHLHRWQVAHALRRSGRKAAQKTLDLVGRRANLAGSISLRPRAADHIRGREVILLDDVYTTGATLDACSQVLQPVTQAAV